MTSRTPITSQRISLSPGADSLFLDATQPKVAQAARAGLAKSPRPSPRKQGPDRFMRRPEVQHATGLSRSSVYRLLEAKDFPAPIRLSLNMVAWLESEVQAWIEDRVAASRKAEELKPSIRARG